MVSDTKCYGIFTNDGSIWGAYVGSPGKIIEFDSNLNIKKTYRLPSGFNDANEISFDTAGSIYVACWESPAKIVKLSPAMHPYRIDISPSSFSLMPGDSITLTATLKDANGIPLPGEIISWSISGDPLLSGTLKPSYLLTDYAGRSFATYTAGEVPCEVSVKVGAWFYETESEESYVSSIGKVSPSSPLTIPLLIFGVFLLLTRAVSYKSFRRTLITIFIFGFSFVLSYPLGFSYSFSSLVLSAKVPAWFLSGFLFLIVMTVLLSISEQSIKCGLTFGICCWIGIILGLVLPRPESYMAHAGIEAILIALRSTVIEGLTFGGIVATFAYVGRRIWAPKPPLLPKSTPSPSPSPTVYPKKASVSKQVAFTIPSSLKWPDIEDYKTCFQNPQHFILDPDLKDGIIELDKWGIPKAISGRYGCVFKVNYDNKSYAIKCYTLQIENLEKRYEKISRYFNKVKLPFFVDFVYVAKGVLVQDQPYPILKMRWIEGKRLDKFITDNISNSDLIKKVAESFIDCIIRLQKSKIAHGDLHHENIMIIPYEKEFFELFLVDYDGVYIPDFSGELSPELGHPNYQHPKRAATHYNERLDNFASLLIYLSLLAIAENPQLWEKYHDDECLILTQEDLKNPQGSKVIQELLQSSTSQKVQKLTKLLLDALHDDPLSDKICPERLKSF
jgi:predicted Ser/Thr protein kinase